MSLSGLSTIAIIMSYFLYKVKKGPTEVIQGRITAASEAAAAKKLIYAGYYPVWLKREEQLLRKRVVNHSLFSRRVRTKDLADFTRQLSGLLESGFTLFNSLALIEEQIYHPELKQVTEDIRAYIKDGKTFSESIQLYPQLFSSLYINLVRAGETGGVLNETLANISDFLEKQDDFRARFIAALIYPVFIGAVGLMSIFVLIGFVIPRLATIFTDMGETLPFSTQILIGMSNFIRARWVLLGIIGGALICLIRNIRMDKFTKMAIDRFKLKTPLLGRLIEYSELARFLRTLSILLKSGVPILGALRITEGVIENEVIKEDVRRLYVNVKAGSALASAIKKETSFPRVIVNMTALGEEAGILPGTLLKIATKYELEVNRSVRALAALLEPFMILIMGLIVGFVVISMLLPVFQISLMAH